MQNVSAGPVTHGRFSTGAVTPNGRFSGASAAGQNVIVKIPHGILYFLVSVSSFFCFFFLVYFLVVSIVRPYLKIRLCAAFRTHGLPAFGYKLFDIRPNVVLLLRKASSSRAIICVRAFSFVLSDLLIARARAQRKL